MALESIASYYFLYRTAQTTAILFTSTVAGLLIFNFLVTKGYIKKD